MHTPHRLPFVLAFLALSACAAPEQDPETAPPMDAAAMKDTIEAREREWSAAFLTGDGAAVAALYTEDAASIPPTGDWHRGRAAIAQDLQPRFDSVTFATREDVTDEVIPLGPDYAFEVGHYNSSGTYKVGGKPSTSSGRYVVLWRKDADGIWRIHRDIGTEAPAEAPAAP
jgi:uncharacterized protein (TIGR02246 family)